MRTLRTVRLAQAVLLLASAAPALIAHRGQQVWLTIGLHLLATLAFCVLAREVVRGSFAPRPREAFALTLGLMLLALLLSPQLSDDIWRYLFEGRLVTAGVNPYLTPPSAPEAAHLREAFWPLINNKDIPAAYPPAVQWALALAVTVSPTPLGPKLVFGLCALLTFAALWCYLPRLGIARERALVFGWCPLVWLECAGEGHSDALAALFMVLALWASVAARPRLAGVCLAVATAGKLFPCVLLPFLARRSPRVCATFVLTLALLYAPFLAEPRALFGGTLEYAARWRANDSAFAVVHWLTELLMSPWRDGDGYVGWLAGHEVQRLAKLPLLALGAWLLLRCWKKDESPERVAYLFLLFFIAFAPTMHPWYVVLLVPWLCVFPRPGLLLFTGTVTFAYHVLPAWLDGGVWRDSVWVKVLEYVPFYLGWV